MPETASKRYNRKNDVATISIKILRRIIYVLRHPLIAYIKLSDLNFFEKHVKKSVRLI